MAKAPAMTCNVSPSIRQHLVPIDQVHADPANLRIHGDESLRAIRASFARFGQQKPIVVDAHNVTVAGAGQLEAARQLGWTHIAAVQSELTGVERVGYAIADNRSAELSDWDRVALATTLNAMASEDLEVTGFDQDDLAELLSDGEDAPEVDTPAVGDVATTRPGDLWELGEHRLLCGSSIIAADVDRLMAGDKAALVATDPPYLVDYTGVRMGDRGKDWSGVYREVEIQDPQTFFNSVFANVVRVMAPHAAVYCWHAQKRIVEILKAWDEHGLLDHQQIIWVKPVSVFGSVFWHFRHEPCLMGWREGSRPPHDGKQGFDSVWTAPGASIPLEQLSRAQLIALIRDSSSAWEVGWGGNARPVGNEHPTQKPVELFARPMRKHTVIGDVVFEPFSGSGTQLVAAEQLRRRCRAMELEPVFVDVAVRRWQNLTGKPARLAGDGRTFDEISQERAACPAAPSSPATTPAADPSPPRPTAKPTKSSTGPKPGKAPKGRRTAAVTEPTGAGSEA